MTTGRRPDIAVPEFLLWCTLAVCALYYLYRYPFRINDASTSPTYGATPLELQAGKYILLGMLAAAAAGYAAVRGCLRPSPRELLFAALAAFATGRAIAAGLAGGGLSTADNVAPLVAIVPVLLLLGSAVMRTTRANRVAHAGLLFAAALLVAHAAANVVQIALWLVVDRLPALAYENTNLVRFGGLWDDPNSSGAYAAAFLVVLLSGRAGFTRRAWISLGALGLFNVAVSMSFSAAVLLIVGAACVAGLRFARRRWPSGRTDGVALVTATAAAVGCLASAAFAWPLVVDLPVVGDVFELKEESLRLRLERDTHFATPDSTVEWLVGSNSPPATENTYGNWFASSGLVGVTLLLVAAGWSVFSTRHTPEFVWVAPLAVGVGVASMFVPHLNVFPVAALFGLALGLAASRGERPLPKGHESPSPITPSDAR